jgi:hypothetical protein
MEDKKLYCCKLAISDPAFISVTYAFNTAEELIKQIEEYPNEKFKVWIKPVKSFEKNLHERSKTPKSN